MGGEEGLSYEQCQKKAESDSRCSNALTSNGADFCWCVPKGWVCSHGRTRRPGYAIWGRYTPKPFGNIKTFAAISVGPRASRFKVWSRGVSGLQSAVTIAPNILIVS